jgi:hypothetical protein
MMRPAVLLGECTGRRVAMMQALGWGRMWITRMAEPYPGEPWGVDNGAFRDYLAGRPFNTDRFRRQLDRCLPFGRPFLAIAPDIVGGGLASLEFSLDWLDHLPADWPWYLALQNGITTEDVAPHLERFAGLFLGGDTRFKGSAPSWARLAHEHGKPFHYGRAGTLRKLAHAIEAGADSIDSAFPMWTHERWETFAHRWMHGNPQYRLFREAA